MRLPPSTMAAFGWRLLRLGLPAIWLLAACYSPRLDFQSGALACDEGACPPGYECHSDRRCWRPGTTIDARDDAPLAVDTDAGAAVCSGAERSCASPTQPRHCEAGAWVDDPPCGATTPICDHGQCAVSCVAPASRCRDERTPETCNASGFWDALPMCEFACTGDGTCTGECVPFSRECRDGNHVWECGRDGTWALKETCPIVCENAACGGECTSGQTRCSATQSKVPQTCSGGHWLDQAPCAYACLSDGTCAPECDPLGPRTCIGGDAYQCDAIGRWALAEDCTTNCSAGACTGACADGTKQCSGIGNQTPQTCTSGVWVDGTPCEFVCDQGSCVVTECHPNVDKKCEGGFPYSCDSAGHFVKGSACAFVCDGDQCGGICKPGTFRCNGSTNLEKCAADGKSWILDHACPYGCSNNQCNACSPDSRATTCQGKCGTVLDNCGAPVDCGDDCATTHGANWSCGASQTCVCTRDVAADCSGKCGTITDRCGFSVDCSAAGSGGVACNSAGQLCLSNHSCCTQEPLGTTCSGDPGDDCNTSVPNNCGAQATCSSSCDSGFTCGGNGATPNKCSCAPGSVRCVGSVAQTCLGGLAWGNDMSCSVACVDGVGCGTCTPGTTQCADATHVETCQPGGTFGAPTACPSATPACRPSTQSCGGVCVPGSRMCGIDPVGGGPALLECDPEGQWSIVVQPCAFTCTGTTSPACTGECNPGDTKCSGDSLLTCGPSFTYASGTSTACGGTKHCGVSGGVASCCAENDAALCPGTGGTPCSTTVTKSCGYQLTCGSTCTDDFTCDPTAKLCKCSPGTHDCQGSTQRLCDATGTAWINPVACANGCQAGACCVSDAQFCADGRWCTPQSYCGRTVDCTAAFGSCETRFPGDHYGCGTFVAGKCTCTPGTTDNDPCDSSVCGDNGTWVDGSRCSCCCDGESCLPATTCQHANGECL